MIHEPAVLRVASSICAPELGSLEQPIVGSDFSTVVEQSSVSTDGSPLNVRERTETGENSIAKGSERPDHRTVPASSGMIHEPAVLRVASSICAPELGSLEQPIVGSDFSTVVEQSSVSIDGSPLNVHERPRRRRQGRPPKLQRVRAKILAACEFRMQFTPKMEIKEADSKLLLKMSNDPTAAKYACSILRALKQEANEQITPGEDQSGTVASF